MSGDKREYGDYQTPEDFCAEICAYVLESCGTKGLEAVFEPSCGIGNFISAVSKRLSLPVSGVEIDPEYARRASERLPGAHIVNGNIFDCDIDAVCPYRNVLVIGNPPWATNSALRHNLPQKSNFKKLRGIDALTGSSNFDICEYIILRMAEHFSGTNSVICMLCKTSVARNVLLETDRKRIPCRSAEMLCFDARKVFGVSASACVLIIQLSVEKVYSPVICSVKNMRSPEIIDRLSVFDGVLRSENTPAEELEGKCRLKWRSGVKHDCGRVMELELMDGKLFNRYKERVSVEPDMIFPLAKSSTFKKPVVSDFKKYVIVTQRSAGQDTGYIENEYPLLWEYLTEHDKDFKSRKSVIYKKAGGFSMFGIGDYSFSPYKVGISGFYKKPFFSLLVSDKPVMTDDTSYFLPFSRYDDAYAAMLLLNSRRVREHLAASSFSDSKRPFTAKLLSRLDLVKCIASVSFKELEESETQLGLEARATEAMYEGLYTNLRSEQYSKS